MKQPRDRKLKNNFSDALIQNPDQNVEIHAVEFQTIKCSAFFNLELNNTFKLRVTGYKKKKKNQMDSNKLKVRRANKSLERSSGQNKFVPT